MTSRRRKPLTAMQVSRGVAREQLGKSGLTGRARELGRPYPPARTSA